MQANGVRIHSSGRTRTSQRGPVRTTWRLHELRGGNASSKKPAKTWTVHEVSFSPAAFVFDFVVRARNGDDSKT